MAVLEILTYPDERLKQVAEPVEVFDDELQQFIDDLEETRQAGPAAVGIAATQVGRLQRIIIVDVSANPKNKSHGLLILVNPEVVEASQNKKGREGCLSVPDYTGNVKRANKITLKAQDRFGEPLEFKMEGFEARAVQHEIDHLNGMLFLDRLVSRQTDLFRRKVYSE